jgi:hypothetical protein
VAPRSALAAGAAALFILACGQAPLPAHLGGLPRGRVWTGKNAARLVDRMHGRPVAPLDSTVAQYGRSGQLRVWLSRYADPAAANRALAAMVDRLSSGETPFLPPHEQAGDPGRWYTIGPGGHHVLWVSGKTLYWLEGDPAVLFRALVELPEPRRGRWT